MAMLAMKICRCGGGDGQTETEDGGVVSGNSTGAMAPVTNRRTWSFSYGG